MVKPIICPSMLSSDFAQLAQEAERMVASGADYLHMDVMDGHFVPNLTLGAPIVKALSKHTKAFLDCHLMVTDPDRWIDDFAAAGANMFTFHVEASSDSAETIRKIKQKGMKAGIAISPPTPTTRITPFINLVDMVLIMTVNPGFGGQKMMPACLDKVREVRALAPHVDIQVDGGLDVTNIHLAAEAGANVIVAGTGIFGAKDPKEAITTMRAAVTACL